MKYADIKTHHHTKTSENTQPNCLFLTMSQSRIFGVDEYGQDTED